MQSCTCIPPGLQWEARPHFFPDGNRLHLCPLSAHQLHMRMPHVRGPGIPVRSDQAYIEWNRRSNGSVQELAYGEELNEDGNPAGASQVSSRYSCVFGEQVRARIKTTQVSGQRLKAEYGQGIAVSPAPNPAGRAKILLIYRTHSRWLLIKNVEGQLSRGTTLLRRHQNGRKRDQTQAEASPTSDDGSGSDRHDAGQA